MWPMTSRDAPLMHLQGDDMLEASLLGAADNKPGMSSILAEEAVLLGDPTPQVTHAATTHPSDCPEETPEPKGTAE